MESIYKSIFKQIIFFYQGKNIYLLIDSETSTIKQTYSFIPSICIEVQMMYALVSKPCEASLDLNKTAC